MALIKSISGIRGTIGGEAGENLTPIDVVKFTAAYGLWLKQATKAKGKLRVVVGRDARLSGAIVESLSISTLLSLGIDVLNIGLSTTPTVEVAVSEELADGGIIFTASHNPKQWNALKLLNHKGEFISAEDGAEVLSIASSENFWFSGIDDLGQLETKDNYIDVHIEKVLAMPLAQIQRIREAKFKVVVDAVNSTGGIVVPKLLERLGVEVIRLYCEPNGHFPHNPEPLKEHLGDISKKVIETGAHLGVVVDPDVDRLALVCEDGSMFGEEYTLVACADYVLGKTPGNTVSNMSSTWALKEITEKYGQAYSASAVGEVNVVNMMKAQHAIIGGEGNGGVIYPEQHYGRDALVGIVLFLSLLAERKTKVSQLRDSYPKFYMSKNKIELAQGADTNLVLEAIAERYKDESISRLDGVKISFADSWVHLRTSNTEPIVRIITEAKTQQTADSLAAKVLNEVKTLL